MIDNPQSQNKKVLIFDYDCTLTKVHVHNHLFEHLLDFASLRGKELGECLCEFAPTALELFKEQCLNGNIKHGAELAKTLVKAHENGVAIAVASFTWFEEVVNPTLEKILLDAEVAPEQVAYILESVLVVGGYPSDNGPIIGGGKPNHPSAKQGHIEKIMHHFGIENPKDVMLVDDSCTNCLVARQNQHKAVVVPASPNASASYFIKIHEFLKTPDSGHDFLRQATDSLRHTSFSSDDEDTAEFLTDSFDASSLDSIEPLVFSSGLQRSGLSCSAEMPEKERDPVGYTLSSSH